MQQKQQKNQNRRKRQSGFTLIEILGVLALIGVLAGIAYSMFDTASKEDMARRVHDANILSQTMPTAMIEVHTLNRTLADTTKAMLTNAGAPPKNSLGQEWSVAVATTHKVEIVWPTAGASDPDAYGQGLVTALTTGLTNPGMLAATPPTYNADTDTLTVTYTR